MKRDVGTADRIIRIAVGSFLLFQALVNGQVWGYTGMVPLLTGSIGWCPSYSMLGVSTVCGCSGDSCGTKREEVNP
ncbi:MAG: DUF2892 domain-containing protein [Geobacteraceae bacterium]|nr:DUF2892 domain-containing protein [Geobacteraceae bacterium]